MGYLCGDVNIKLNTIERGRRFIVDLHDFLHQVEEPSSSTHCITSNQHGSSLKQLQVWLNRKAPYDRPRRTIRTTQHGMFLAQIKISALREVLAFAIRITTDGCVSVYATVGDGELPLCE